MKIYITYLLLFLSLGATAQFKGGRADGADRKQLIQTALNGAIGGTRVLYQGGSGDGFHQQTFGSYLNGTTAAAIYAGGRGDGHSNYTQCSYLQGTSDAVLYTGGAGDGFSTKNMQAFLNGTLVTILYSGGSGDGFSAKPFSGFLNNTQLDKLYSGGIGDGFSAKSHNGFLSGTNSTILYAGGQGDGFALATRQLFVSGIPASILYNGGAGDGFAKAEYMGTIVVLPLELISFDAIKQQDYVLLQWITENEEGTDYFTVERSQSGSFFQGIASLPARGNARSQQYSKIDSMPLPSRSYYRLRWTDIDGKKGYSHIKSVVFDKENTLDFILFPNPSDGKKLSIQLGGQASMEQLTVAIYDLEGRRIVQKSSPTIIGNVITLQLPHSLAKGTYVVKLLRAGAAASKILIVQ